MSVTEDVVLVPLHRAGAEVLYMAASVGLDTDEQQGVDLDAGFAANQALRRSLDIEPEAEVAVVQGGIRALESIFSHEKDFILIDPDDGVGFIGGEDYSALYRLLALLRDGTVEEAVPSDDLLRVEYPNEATVRVRGATATVRLEPDPEPEFADSHLRVRLFCDPPPRGSSREVYSGPILIRDLGGEP